MAHPVVAYLMVLAINALQVAIGKKDIADSCCTAYRRFFTLMITDRSNTEGGITFTVAQIS
jgi:hypothetical protein